MRLLYAVLLVILIAGCQSTSLSSTSTGLTHIGVAEAAEAAGDYGMAETIYARAASEMPADAGLQLRYADMLIKQGKIAEARDLLSRRVKTASSPQALRGALGMLDLLQGEPARAIIAFDSMTTDPMRWAANKAVALDMLGRHVEAQALYRRCLEAQPDDPVIITDLALSLALSGHAAEATRVAAPLLARSDLPPRIQSSLGIVQAANGDLPSAHRALGPAVTDQQLLRMANAMNKRSDGL